jgi:aspartate racemase
MKTIGLIGGMSWESTREYYRIMNEEVKKRLGDSHSCRCILYSVDFAEIQELQHSGAWEELTSSMISIAGKLESAGAEMLLICTNTMHAMADRVQASIKIPLIHIADTVAEEIKTRGMQKVGLLGTRFTMEQDFYRIRLKEKFGIDVIIPDENERKNVHSIIYKELIAGIIKKESKDIYKSVIQKLFRNGAEGVILGCTEIPLLITGEDCDIPLFDTTLLHARKAVGLALKKE